MRNRMRAVAGVLLTIALAGSIQLRALDGTSGGMTLRELIRRAYDSHGIHSPSQVVGGPDWIASERFDPAPDHQPVRGANAGTPSLTQLQEELAKRFKLKVHGEVGQRPQYALVLSTSAFDVRLRFAGAIMRRALTGESNSSTPVNFLALQQPVGVRLETHHDPIHILVVDHAEAPAENQ